MSRNGKKAILLAVLAAALIACSPGYTVGQKEKAPAIPAAQPSGQILTPTLEQIQYSFRQVADMVLPVVVEITTEEVVRRTVPRSPFDFFFRNPEEQSPEEQEFRQPGLGSGVIVQKSGGKVYVLTNNHVVGEADKIHVRLHDERQYDAEIVGTDPRRDLALISFATRDDVPLAKLGDSGALKVGDLVLAVGNPFGFESTVTMGIVSALGRQAERAGSVADFTDYIQTDAAINPGNSGGALVNLRGEVIGINTWIASRTGSYMGLGFAVPINNARKAINDFITKGRVEYGWLGVQIGTVDQERFPGFAQDLGIAGKNGAFVFNVFKGSPAQKAGIQPGDLITEVDGRAVEDDNALTKIVGNLPPGEVHRFSLIRERKEVTLNIKLTIREEEKEIAAQSKNLWPGLYVTTLTEELRKQLDVPAGVRGLLVSGVLEGSPSAIAGLKQGDVITRINDRPASGALVFYTELNDTSSREVRMRVFREGTEVLLGMMR